MTRSPGGAKAAGVAEVLERRLMLAVGADGAQPDVDASHRPDAGRGAAAVTVRWEGQDVRPVPGRWLVRLDGWSDDFRSAGHRRATVERRFRSKRPDLRLLDHFPASTGTRPGSGATYFGP